MSVYERKLPFVGDSNWDIYVDGSGNLWSVPKPACKGADDSHYGQSPIKRLMSNGYLSYYQLAIIETAQNYAI